MGGNRLGGPILYVGDGIGRRNLPPSLARLRPTRIRQRAHRIPTMTMKIRIASPLLALALPLCAQDAGAPADAENMFYKAFYLEKGQRDFAGAMALYEQFLTKAPEHKLAAEAAKQQDRLLDATGKTKERDAFKAKYEKLLGAVAAAPAPTPATQERPAGERPARGQGGQQGGQGGRARGGVMGAIMSGKPVAEMSDEEITQLKTGIDQSSGMIDMMRERNPEQADKLEKGMADLKAALDKGDKAAAQTALDALKGAMPQRGGRGNRGGGGGEAGGAGGRGGNAGGGGGGGGNAGGAGGGGGGGGGN